MEINITYKSPEHEAAFLSELQRIPHIVNPESGRVNPYWGASLYLLSALTRWPEFRIAVIGEDYMMFTAAKEAFNLSQNERIVVELEDYEETKKELADWVNASPEELADVIAGM